MLIETRLRLLALDVDGTLLDPAGRLLPATARAVRSAADAGIQPVLCTGRRYRRARPIADLLELDVPIVCNSGALVKDPANHATLWRADLPAEILKALFELFQSAGQPAVSFTDQDPSRADFLVAKYPSGRLHFDEYVRLNHGHAEVDPGWMERNGEGGPHFHLCAVGDRQEMLDFEAVIHQFLPQQVRTFVQRSIRYAGTMCEVIDPEASKWSAIMHLAQQWGISASEICAVGDDRNDVAMIQGAGLGVAMGHAPPEVMAVADIVTLDHENEGLARFIEELLSR